MKRQRAWCFLALGAILAAGLACGYLANHCANRAPFTAEEIRAALDRPLPTPENTSVLLVEPIQMGGSDDVVTGHGMIVLDISELSWQEAEAIPDFYRNYFSSRLPELVNKSKTGWQADHYDFSTGEVARYFDGEYTWSQGAKEEDEVVTWTRRLRLVGKSAFYEITAKAMDIEPLPERGENYYVRRRIVNLADPIRGQRIMRLSFSLEAFNLK